MAQTHEPKHSASSDLRWYYARTDAGPLRSNFGGMVNRLVLGRAHGDSPHTDFEEERLDDAARAGEIGRALRGLDPQTEDILWRAFGMERRRELALLGELSAVAPLTKAAAEAHRRIGRSEPFGEWLRHLFRRRTKALAVPLLNAILEEAKALRGRAMAAFLAARRRVSRHG